MKFTRLRLTGFKSFVDATELRIEPGLTGVVGPNGCGKSNLLEALRWVMGESKPKSLRGGAMEDVIFAGTAQRAPRNFADVSLLMDNSARTAPAPFNSEDQIEVSRRIERDLGSAYRMNGKDVRQKDVQLLFADAATGAHSPALVSQGRIGALITAKPTDRRAILEEAAGISGLHSRRKEAEQRLQAAETNLTRLDDVLGQMEAQIATLQRQSRQAQRYRKLSEDIRLTEALLMYQRWTQSARQLAAAESELRAIAAKVAELTTASSAAARMQAETGGQLPALRTAEAEAAAALQRLVRTGEELSAEAQRLSDRQAELTRQAEDMAASITRENTLRADGKASLDALMAEAEVLQQRLAQAEARKGDAAHRVSEAERAASAGEKQFDELTGRNADALARRRAFESQQASATQRIQRLDGELARVAENMAAMAGLPEGAQGIAALEADESASEHDIAQISSTLITLEAARSDAESRLQAAQSGMDTDRARLQSSLDETRRTLRAALETAQEQSAEQVQAVRAEVRALEAESQSLERLLANSAQSTDGHPPVLDEIAVEEGFERALAAALSDDLSAPVRAAGDDAHRHWTATRASDAAPRDPALPEGVERLSDRVNAPAALARRLAQIGVVDSSAALARFSGSLQTGQRLVSKDGHLLRWDGFRASQPARADAQERLAQRNRLKAVGIDLQRARSVLAAAEADGAGKVEQARAALADQTAEAEAALAVALDGHQNAIAAAREAYAAASAAEKQAREQRSAAEARAAAARKSLAAAREAAIEQAARLDALKATAERLEDERGVRRTEQQAADAGLSDLPDTEALAGEISEQRKRVERQRQELANARATLDGLLRQIDSDKARLDIIARDREAWSVRLTSGEAQLATLAERQTTLEEERHRLEARPTEIAQAREALAGEITAAQARRQDAAEALTMGEEALRVQDVQVRQLAEAMMEAREARARLDAHVESAGARRQELALAIGDAFKCPPSHLPEKLGLTAELEKAESAEVLDTRLDRYKGERERLGAVNLRADLELQEISETRERSIAERAELETAIAKLRGSIGSLNREGRARLLKAFEEVNAHFTELFTTLFGGGQAYLALTESDDPLNAGLEIMASPPGKRLQNLSLLSGGEQALTAVALIFAVFLTNPAPICVLDEVDAPLDDANIERFCDLLDVMAGRTDTRFLVVTHNAVTMSRMNRLYGVTMGERGVSQLVSVDLDRAETLLAAE